jgi:MFS transporter, OFA family, oxalate/formate antiporter
MVAALFVVTFSISNPFAAFGVFLPELSDAFGWSRGSISIALSINLVIGGVVGFAIGAIADRSGPRLPLTITVVCAGVGFALASMVDSLWKFYVFVGVVAGIGMSGFYVLSASTVARWFERQRGLALAIVLVGFNLGVMTGGPIAAYLIRGVGWRNAYLTFGVALGVVGGLASLLVRFPRAAEHAGGRARSAERDRSRRAWSVPGVSSSTTADLPSGGMPFREALRDPRLWFLTVGWLLQGFVLLMITVHVVPYARDRGIALERASLTLTGYGIGAAIGRLGFGTAADRFGARWTMPLCFAIQLAALGPLLGAPSQPMLVALLTVFGIGFGGADTLYLKAAPDVFGVRALGSIMGVLTLGWRTGAGLGPPAAGFVHDASGAYTLAFAAAPLVTAASFALFALAARRAR